MKLSMLWRCRRRPIKTVMTVKQLCCLAVSATTFGTMGGGGLCRVWGFTLIAPFARLSQPQGRPFSACAFASGACSPARGVSASWHDTAPVSSSWRRVASGGRSASSSTKLDASLVDPLLIQHVVQGGVLSFAGDVIAQSILSGDDAEVDDKDDGSSEKNSFSIMPSNWDSTRTLAFATFGALYTGGAQHFIFAFLNTSFSQPIYRLLLAQFFFIPFCYYPTFLLMVPALRAAGGFNVDRILNPSSNPEVVKVKKELTDQILGRLPATLLRNWSFWLPVQFIQFTYIPTDMHVTYCAAFGVIWNAILSWSTMVNSPPTGDEKEGEEEASKS